MSQVLVPPLASEYNIVKDAWMDQKLWNDDNFIEVLSEDCPAKVKAKVVEAIYQYLDLYVDFPLIFPTMLPCDSQICAWRSCITCVWVT